MIKEGIHYCDFCKKKKNKAHTNCFECGRDICPEHGKALKNIDERWVGYLCTDCLKKARAGKSKEIYHLPALLYEDENARKVIQN